MLFSELIFVANLHFFYVQFVLTPHYPASLISRFGSLHERQNTVYMRRTRFHMVHAAMVKSPPP